MKHATAFFEYARKRFAIHLARDVEGRPGPWTDDPILQSYRFCNVHREDDKVTRWFRENIRGPLAQDNAVLLATVAFRWFNRIESGEVMIHRYPADLTNGKFNGPALKRGLLEKYPKGPWTTGAYMIKTPAGMNKIDGLVWCIENVAKDSEHLAARMRGEEVTLEGAWEVLREYPYLGDFMAYEVVTDLRHTSLLENAPDVLTWANPGPGAARGLARVLGLPLDAFNRHSAKDRATLIAGMRDLLELSKCQEYWPQEWPKWELREVEHTLCEYDKWQRARLGEGRPKQIFRPNLRPQEQ